MNGVVEPLPAAMDYDQVVKAVQAEIDDEGLTQAQVAKEAGIASSTLSQILSGSYKGSPREMGANLGQWLTRRDRQHRATAIMPALPAYIETPTARLIREALDYAHLFQDITVIYSGAGLGKTTAMREYARKNTAVWIVTVTPDCASAPVLLQEVAIAMGHKDAPLHPAVLRREIVRRMRDTNGLLIVDEAQHLTVQALEAVRSLHDLTEVGLALLGNAKVYDRIHGANRQKEDFAQIFSRIGRKLKLVRPKRGDIHAIAKAFNVDDKAAIEQLEKIAQHPGALRGVVKTIRLAFVMAAGEQSAVRLHHLNAAWHSLQGDDALPAG